MVQKSPTHLRRIISGTLVSVSSQQPRVRRQLQQTIDCSQVNPDSKPTVTETVNGEASTSVERNKTLNMGRHCACRQPLWLWTTHSKQNLLELGKCKCDRRLVLRVALRCTALHSAPHVHTDPFSLSLFLSFSLSLFLSLSLSFSLSFSLSLLSLLSLVSLLSLSLLSLALFSPEDVHTNADDPSVRGAVSQFVFLGLGSCKVDTIQASHAQSLSLLWLGLSRLGTHAGRDCVR